MEFEPDLARRSPDLPLAFILPLADSPILVREPCVVLFRFALYKKVPWNLHRSLDGPLPVPALRCFVVSGLNYVNLSTKKSKEVPS